MRCVVTAGPTFEPLDQVRRLTNFSTGRLGAELAVHLAHAGHEVILLRGESATWPAPADASVRVEPFTTTASLGERFQALAGATVDAVFHAAAVSDFAFGPVWRRESDGRLTEVRAGKLSTRAGVLLAELVPTPKLLARLRGWFPRAWLAGWKYEVDGDRASALAAGAEQLAQTGTDLCVVNGPAYGDGFGLVAPQTAPTHCADAGELLAELAGWLVAGLR
jgi:phosphopantothenoylcysteine synthetase/decarboxylase